MEYEVVDIESVPKPAKAPSKSAQDILDMLAAIPAGKAVKVTPESGKGAKGVRIGISRIINNRKLTGYTVTSDDKYVYVARAKK